MRIVVFGAGGFIGGWICEDMAVRGGIDVLACVRSWGSAARLARRGIRIAQINLEEDDDIASHISGADVVVNAAMPSPPSEARAAARLYNACDKVGVGRFIQFSSIAVYGDASGMVGEDAEMRPLDAYGIGKVELEQVLLKAATETRPQLLILRPTIVYGPFSDIWTVRYARRILDGRWMSLGAAGSGTCNLVHGHDVAKAVLLAATSKLPTGSHVVNINGDEVVTWNDYIQRFGDALGIGNRRIPNSIGFRLSALAVHAMRRGGSWAKTHGLRRPAGRPAPTFDRAQGVVNLYPTLGELRLLRRRVRYSPERAQKVLGFVSSISLNDGLRQCADWCRVHGVV